MPLDSSPPKTKAAYWELKDGLTILEPLCEEGTVGPFVHCPFVQISQSVRPTPPHTKTLLSDGVLIVKQECRYLFSFMDATCVHLSLDMSYMYTSL